MTNIRLLNSYVEKEYETATLYYSALTDDFKNVHISVEFTISLIEPAFASMVIAKVENGEACNWTDYDMTYEEIDKLLSIASDTIREVVDHYERYH